RGYVDPPPPPSRIGGHVGALAHRLDVWSQAAWHRRWERLPLRFTVWTTIAVVAASLFEIIPTFLIKSNVPTIASVQPYTPLELHGRDIYVAEGCYNCHSQMIRPIVSETKRYGEYSKPGEFVYDRPFQWGSRRIGPDLAREGGKQSNLWHVLHFEDPRQVTPRSIMPAYTHLLTRPIDFDAIPASVETMRKLGVPYDDATLHGAADLARAQAAEIAATIVEQGGKSGLEDKEVVALIAYLQRLGTDLFKPPPEPSGGPAAAMGDAGGGGGR
ncbi:MAG TPA: cytochrome-c oxidase, cbb3-type subunit II, partial [Phycisphaerae bacterium]|nr:cytochrome-c oxidase, cbb3-type subunit II [Phycisphaerae bacterium]